MNDFPSHQQPRDVLRGEQCPYCGGVPMLTDSKAIYGKSYGMIYLCEPCNAYVGCHKGGKGTTALGRLANKELRSWKMAAHREFDSLWKMSKRKYRRQKAYQWLAGELKIDSHFAHIGMFNVEQCKETVAACRNLRQKLIRQSGM